MAIEALTTAVEAQPNYPEAHLLLGKCLLDSWKGDQARDEANIAIGQGAAMFPAYRLLGEIDCAQEKFEAATTDFETALRYAQPSDENDAARLQVELDDLRRFIDNLKRFGALEAQQNSPDITRPVPLNSPQPRYTEEARSLKIQGPVSLEVLITEDGDVDSVIVLRGLPAGLDQQAIAAAKQLKFSPAKRNGRSISYWMKVLIEFILK